MNKFRPKTEKPCKVCGKMFLPTNPRNTICSDECRDVYYRSKGLNKTYRNGEYIHSGYNQKGGVMYRYLVDIEKCELCGSTENLLVHHKDFNHSHNVKENLMVLCKKCHQNLHCIRDEKGRFTSRKV